VHYLSGSKVAALGLALLAPLASGCVVHTRGGYYRGRAPAVVVAPRPAAVVVGVPTPAVVGPATPMVVGPSATPMVTGPAVPTGAPVFLGERSVDFRVDRDVVSLAARPEMFRGIFFEAVDGGIEMLDCDVSFENGQRIDLPVRRFLAPGTRTQVFDFPGSMRNISRVSLVYRTATRRTGRALVRIWGVQ